MNQTTPALDEFLIDIPQPNKTPNTYYTKEELSALNPSHVPEHIAIIPDGNRRWANRHETTTSSGHEHGADIIIDIVKAAKEIGVKTITFYVFSTENWLRPQEEVDAFMWLLETYLTEQTETMIDGGIRLHTIGDQSKLSPSLTATINKTKISTAKCNEVDLILAINYGGRDEITRAFKRMLADTEKGILDKESITEATVNRYLDTSGWKDPDLLIRTSGEERISNFLIWQVSYSEIQSVEVLWPDFTPQHLYRAVKDYQIRERRLGN
ncbi:MAG: polyprenyl diphosphate synthase [Chlamydiota bacterium]|nr:polyprenyl diphosphate synthase [Chlamydiota bacterium]